MLGCFFCIPSLATPVSHITCLNGFSSCRCVYFFPKIFFIVNSSCSRGFCSKTSCYYHYYDYYYYYYYNYNYSPGKPGGGSFQVLEV